MIDLKHTKESAQEAFINLTKLGARLNPDEGKRLHMLMQIVTGYVTQLEERVCEFNND